MWRSVFLFSTKGVFPSRLNQSTFIYLEDQLYTYLFMSSTRQGPSLPTPLLLRVCPSSCRDRCWVPRPIILGWLHVTERGLGGHTLCAPVSSRLNFLFDLTHNLLEHSQPLVSSGRTRTTSPFHTSRLSPCPGPSSHSSPPSTLVSTRLRMLQEI